MRSDRAAPPPAERHTEHGTEPGARGDGVGDMDDASRACAAAAADVAERLERTLRMLGRVHSAVQGLRDRSQANGGALTS